MHVTLCSEEPAFKGVYSNGGYATRAVRLGDMFGNLPVIGIYSRNEFEDIARLAPERLANGIERREPNRSGLSGLEHRKIGECDSDLFRKIGERHSTLMQHVVESYDYRHDQTVASSSSRMRAP